MKSMSVSGMIFTSSHSLGRSRFRYAEDYTCANAAGFSGNADKLGIPFFVEKPAVEIACLDLEGVLVPEIWIAFADHTGIKELRATTRDIPDYDVLMQQRLRLLDKHGYGLPQIQEVIAQLKPLPGAIEFVNWLRERFQVVIISDTFYQFAQVQAEIRGISSFGGKELQ